MRAIASLIKKRNARENKKRNLSDEKTILFIFEKVVRKEFGDIGYAKIKPVCFTQKKIIAQSASANWASELFIHREAVRKEVNRMLGSNYVLDITIKTSS